MSETVPTYAILFEPTEVELEQWPFLRIGGVTMDSLNPMAQHFCHMYNAYKMNMLVYGLLTGKQEIPEKGGEVYLQILEKAKELKTDPYKSRDKAEECLKVLVNLRDGKYAGQGITCDTLLTLKPTVLN